MDRVLCVRLNCSSHVKSRRLQNDSEKGRKKGIVEREEKQRIRARMEFRGNQMEMANGPSEKSPDYSETSIPTRRVRCTVSVGWKRNFNSLPVNIFCLYMSHQAREFFSDKYIFILEFKKDDKQKLISWKTSHKCKIYFVYIVLFLQH